MSDERTADKSKTQYIIEDLKMTPKVFAYAIPIGIILVGGIAHNAGCTP